MKKEIYPKLTVVGAGPGDPELITVKAINALSEADVILYDALVNKELLKYAPIDALKIYVGKRKNKHEYTQEQINNLIVDLAFTHGRVVRLKGGDPFVFGRGSEEIQFADAFNIETAIVPGISSSIGVPGASGIPVTHRGISESFWVITATKQNGELSQDIYDAAKTNATLVILMGLNKLQQITSIFSNAGKVNTPVAVIQNGTLATENVAIGTIDTIVNEVKEQNIKSPAIIVIGDVVKFHKYYESVGSHINYSLN
ncbi:MAG: uroporphyrinogen-III C-methyltransferase [Bacteroidetes bacterium]|nr:uroporphyrinogen-III C-methyltransferase [Bacteroidota bacterium]MCA6444022.1 uroporphyrinogen-III C-methyltransferase [Bacteroidota bacterium]